MDTIPVSLTHKMIQDEQFWFLTAANYYTKASLGNSYNQSMKLRLSMLH